MRYEDLRREVKRLWAVQVIDNPRHLGDVTAALSPPTGPFHTAGSYTCATLLDHPLPHIMARICLGFDRRTHPDVRSWTLLHELGHHVEALGGRRPLGLGDPPAALYAGELRAWEHAEAIGPTLGVRCSRRAELLREWALDGYASLLPTWIPEEVV